MSIGSAFSAAAPLIGGAASKIGSSGRESAARGTASQSLVLNQNSPFGSSAFNPSNQSLSFGLTPGANRALGSTPSLLNPNVNIPRVNSAAINSSTDEIRKNVSGTSERVRDSLADTGREVGAISNLSRSDLNTSLAQSSALFGKLQQGEVLTRDQLSGLLARIRPGFGELTASVEATIESERERTQSNLRDNLSRRRVLGSSFAEGTISSSNLEFAEKKRQARAESFLAELDLSRQVLQQQFTNQFETVNLGLQRINDEVSARLQQFQTEVGARLQLGQLETSSLLGLGQLSLDSERTRIQAELEKTGLDQQAAIAESQQQVDRTLANLGISEEQFDRFLEIGRLTNDISQGLQSSFATNDRLQQELLAEGARGRGGAFSDAAGSIGDAVGGFDFGSIFGGGSDLAGGSGSDVFNLDTSAVSGTTFF